MGRNYYRPLLWTFALLLLALSTGCRAPKNATLIAIPPGFNVLPPGNGGGGGGGGGGVPVSIDGISVTRVGGGPIVEGDDIVVTVTFTGDTDPFILGYTFSGNFIDPASIPAMPRTVNSSPDSITVSTLATSNGGSCTVTVGIADNDLNVDTATQTFTIADDPGPGPNPTNNAPVLTAAADDASCSVTVSVVDADGDDVTLAPSTVPAGLAAADGAQTITGGTGSFTFAFSPDDVLAGGGGNITFSADDGNGGTTTATANLLCAGITLAVDTLYAIPSREEVRVGQPLTILVATGLPANPFQYMNGVRVTAPAASGYDYVDNSFNVGAVGGTQAEADGVWAAMNPPGFLLPPDDFIQQATAQNGDFALDFNITPLSGSEITPIGALFNYQATFTTPGTYQIGFEEVNVVSRTYYQDGTQAADLFWADLTNTHAGVRNSVTVVP